MLEALKGEMNKSHKEIQENTFKQVQTLKEEMKYKEIQENSIKQVKEKK